jgi:hypothetical protein
VDLLGKNLAPLAIEDGVVPIALRGWEIATIALD